jgi:hypothetical protein
MQPTKQVHADYFQFCTRPMFAMNFASSSFRQLVPSEGMPSAEGTPSESASYVEHVRNKLVLLSIGKVIGEI